MAHKEYTDGASVKDKKNFAKFLSEDEELVIATGYGKTYLRQRFIIQLIIPWAIWIVIGMIWAYYNDYPLGWGMIGGLIAAGFFSYLQAWWIYHANRYLLTTRRVIIKRGILSFKLKSALYDKITHIEMEQSLYDRLFLHHGTIKIHTAGSEKDELVLNFVEGPIQLKNLLERLINRERERFGGSGGPVVTLEGEVVEDDK